MEHFVIIGNGAAGNRAARGLREGDKDVRITMISAEPTHYLHRHRLARYLVEDKELESLNVHDPEWYDERCLRLRLNQPVVQVNPSEKTILLAHREKIRYDRLLICSGARHRVPEYLSHFQDLISRFSNSTDAIMLKSRIDRVKNLTLLGGDLIGLQLISALLPAGKELTMVLDEYRFWPIEYDHDIKSRLADSLSKKGVRVIRNDYVTDVEKNNSGLLIKTREGEEIMTDQAVLCSGMVPCLEFLSDSGIDVQEGVLVNEQLETSAPEVWAAGECAEIYYPELKDYRCSSGFHNAVTQGELAAKNMLGQKQNARLADPGKVVISGEQFSTYGWKGFSLDEKD